ncbi:uncharacterized protein (DUF58 family) [Pelomonas saccharophila]|uniref:Uncharacterized protein (DUF58 family) n=1 Tax=Roseateles saccharophilus TaxID=304 RepID=A0ABU1YGA3_ROSSA|nr:DUF58 domain-containing protein [Roseateles saccharophilus]MDR7267884.1 uncharacterized protein (DUF58 family) [Roseateles saccharophilus]
MIQALRQRWQAWWQARQAPADTHQTTQRNVYIVPTWAGLAFCGTLGVLLLASINEQLSLGYALTFALTGAGLASMHTTHANLRGLQMDLKAPEGVHAGDEYALELRLHNPGSDRFGIAVSAQLDSGVTEPAWIDVPALGHAVLKLRLPADRRGLRELPRLIVTTRFPLGFFRAWSYWRPAAKVWVYPRPEDGVAPFPTQAEAGSADAASTRRASSGTDFSGVRAYRRGDSMKQILWRKSALALDQGLPLWVRETEAPLAQDLWLDWRDTQGRDVEARLSRLAAWVLAAERLGQPYGLRLGSQEIAPSLGAAHRQACLEALAGFGS